MRSVLLLTAAALLGACAGRELVLEIYHPATATFGTGFGPSFTVQVLDASTKQVVATTSVPSSGSSAKQALFDELALSAGARYTVLLSSAPGAFCPPGGKVVGASPPFVYSKDLKQVAVYVDCADTSNTVGSLLAARSNLAAALLPDPAPHGRVVVAGGVNLSGWLSPGTVLTGTPYDTVEVFDPVTSVATTLVAKLSRARSSLEGAVLPDGSLLLTGGLTKDGLKAPVASSTVDRLQGEQLSALPALGAPRAEHAAIPLAGGRVLIAGGSGASGLASDTAELYDLKGTTPIKGVMSAPRFRPAAGLLDDGKSVYLAGGGWTTAPEPSDLFCLEGSCRGTCEGPCFSSLPGFAAGRARAATAGTVVTCEDGKRSALYLSGGHRRDSAVDTYFDEIYCVDSDRPDAPRLLGHLRHERALHSASLVRGPGGQQRLFVAGGLDAGGGLASAELVPASCPCRTAIGAGDIVEVPLKDKRAGHSAVGLADGGVLLIGGTPGAARVERFTPGL